MKRLMAVAVMLLAWWVTVNFRPVMGPFGDLSSCQSAAVDIGLSYHVMAVCMQKVY